MLIEKSFGKRIYIKRKGCQSKLAAFSFEFNNFTSCIKQL